MKGTGVETSRPRMLPPLGGTVASLLLHAGIIAGAVLFNAHLDALPPEDSASTVVKFLFPTVKPVPRPVMERVSFVGISTNQPTAETVQQGARVRKSTLLPPPPRQVAVEEVHTALPPKTFSEIEVDSAAIRDPDSAGPDYPPKLLELKLEGSTLVRFVVDSTGHVDVASLVVLESTHPDFTQAVRDVLPRMKYQPARLGKHPVAQLVEQRFGFRIAPP